MTGDTFGSAHRDSIEELHRLLKRGGVEQQDIDAICSSGYYLAPRSSCILDSLYGNDQPLSVELIKDKKRRFRREVPVLIARSLGEARELISLGEGVNYISEGMMSFRGQNKEYFIERPFPNPWLEIGGAERQLIPSVWRKYTSAQSLLARPIDPHNPILSGPYADELIYAGLDVQGIHERHAGRCGYFTMGDFEDSPYEDGREYFRRWRDHKLGHYGSAMTALEQHYGFPTSGLDITYDLAVAVFFATHKFVKDDNGKASFSKLGNLENAVVYSLVFRNPPVKRTSWLIRNIPIFEHLPPLRPIRQNCALPFFHYWEFNGAAGALHKVIKIDKDFDFTGVPSAQDLFPSPDEDLFYAKLLEMKRKFPPVFDDVPEYAF